MMLLTLLVLNIEAEILVYMKNASCFSFHATKVLNAMKGGAACFYDRDFGLDLLRLKILEFVI